MSQHPDHESWDSTEWQAANPLPDIEQTGISIPNDHVAPEEDMTSPFTCSKEPTKGDWDRLKPEIEVLYTKHKLKEVMAIMRQKYNLRASEKMYKDRRSAWRISKNIKSQEMEAIVRKTAQRRQAGKASYFQLRTTWVSDARIKRYRRDNKIQSEQQAMALRARTPPELICYTPLASPMTTPRELEIPERLVKVFHEYINSSFDSNSWLVGDSGWCRHKKGLVKNGSINTPGNFCNAIKTAVYLLFSGKSGLAWQSFQIAMSYIVEVVSLEEPRTVFMLVDMILVLSIRFDMSDIALTVINQFHNVSTKLKGERHPLSQSSGLVKGLCASNNMEALPILYQVGMDDFIWRVGRLSRDAVEIQLYQIEWSSEFQHAFDSIGKLQALLKTFRDVGSVSEPCFRMHMQLANELRVARRTQEALEVCESVTKLASDEEGAGSSAWSLMEALRQMSQCHGQLGDLASAEQNIRQAINIGGARYGFKHELVLYLIAEHERVLERCDALNEARQVRDYLERVVSGKYERILREEEEEWQRFQASEEGEKLQRSSE